MVKPTPNDEFGSGNLWNYDSIGLYLFAAGRLNKVNGRKEFFRADIAEIESIIRANYDAVVEVTHEAAAEQYRESLRMAMPKPEIQQAERAAARTDA